MTYAKGRKNYRSSKKRPTKKPLKVAVYKPRPQYARPTYVTPLGQSPATYIKLKFSDVYTHSSNGVNLQNDQFRGNGTFDPQVAVGGGSCPYYSTYSSLYSRYVTYGSKIKVTFSNASSQNVICAVYPAIAGAVLGTSVNDIIEQVNCKSKTIANSAAGGNIKTISMYRSAANLFGVPRIAMDIDDSYSSSITSTPNRQFYWNVISQSTDQTTNSTVRARVDITYYVKFYRPDPIFTV